MTGKPLFPEVEEERQAEERKRREEEREAARKSDAQRLREYGWTQVYYPPDRGEDVREAHVWEHPRHEGRFTYRQAMRLQFDAWQS